MGPAASIETGLLRRPARFSQRALEPAVVGVVENAPS